MSSTSPVRRALWLALTAAPFLLVAATQAYAQIKPTSPVFVIDLTETPNRVAVVAASTFNEALRDDNVVASPLERAMNGCGFPKETPPTETTAPPSVVAAYKAAQADFAMFLKRMHDCVDCLNAHRQTRFITSRNDMVALIVIFQRPVTASDLRPVFHETPRESELVATGKALKRILESGEVLECRSFGYTLQRKRSLFKITLPAPEPGAGSALFETARPAEAEDVVTPEVTLGPVEHWFFSADFAISASQIEIGKQPEADKEKLNNNDFFVALDFSVGDLLADRDNPMQRRSFWQELVIKVQLAPTRRPWEAWAVGLGVRGYRIKTILWNMDAVHPFFSVGREENDDGTGRWRTVFGLGFDPRSLKK